MHPPARQAPESPWAPGGEARAPQPACLSQRLSAQTSRTGVTSEEQRPERGAGRKVETCSTQALLLITRKALPQRGLWGSKERPCKPERTCFSASAV